ncbi:MAG: Twin-arginine translocation pathway signal [Alcaligenaceae bacterium]|nr:MAG: Twin-arginine translocation pathway signal [Alcaligenaceae bacterium]
MMKFSFLRSFSLLAAAGMGAFSGSAWSQEFPTGQTISIVVGFVAGGASDASARLIAKELANNLGQSVVVENKPGAGSMLAAQQVANAKADGTVLMLGSIGPMAVIPHLMKLSFDPLVDLAPITMGVIFPNVLVVPASLDITTFAEFVALAKKNPGKLTYAATGIGSASHLAGELLGQRAGIDIVNIQYKGGSAAMIDLIGGRIDAYYSTPSSAAPHIQSKKLVALATTGLTRPALLLDLPTVAESGYPEFNAVNWYSYVAPGKTPAPILERWNTEFVKVLNTPSVRDALLALGLTPQPMSRRESADYMAKESAIWKAVIKERNIKIE